MAHEITVVNGKASMAYVGETPWHGLGAKLTEGSSIDVWAREAGMQYEVLTAPIAYDVNGKKHVYKDRVVSYRSDNGEGLGVVSRNFQMVQPKDCLAFFEDLATLHGFQLETAGVLFGGRKYWALAKTPKEFSVGKKDVIRGHLMMATACDGSMATIVKYVSTRVVCNNTIQIALGEGNPQGTIRVRHNQKFEAPDVKTELGLYDDAWLKFKEQVLRMAKRKMDSKATTDYLIALMGDPSKPIEEQPHVENMKTINDMFSTQNYIGHELSGNTLWGLVNCVSEWTDWSRARDQNRRLDYAYFGGGADLKVKAMEVAGQFA
jgi:phage/plasmid-like protein (TIGR03299 family)